MNGKDSQVHRGNIATYEDASDEFLHKRKQDLRAQIRNPALTTGEFIRQVATQSAVTFAAAFFSVWNGLNRSIDWAIGKYPWAHKFFVMANGNVYLKDTQTFEKKLEAIAHTVASFFYLEDFGRNKLSLLIDQSLALAEQFGLSSGIEEMKTLRKEFKHITKSSQIPSTDVHFVRQAKLRFPDRRLTDAQLVEAYKNEKMFGMLQQLKKANPSAGIAQICTIWEEMLDIEKSEMKPKNASELGFHAWTSRRLDIMKITAYEDNAKIIARFRNPTTVILASSAALVTGYQAYRFANRQKSLDQEGEMGHIERLEAERAAAGHPHQPNPHQPGR